LIDSVEKSGGNGAIVPLLNDVLAKLFFVVGFCVQCRFEDCGGEPLVGVGGLLLGKTGDGKAKNEYGVKEWAYYHGFRTLILGSESDTFQISAKFANLFGYVLSKSEFLVNFGETADCCR